MGRKPEGPLRAQRVQCASCIFREDGRAIDLRPGRLEEIKATLLTGANQLCHEARDGRGQRKVVCRGGRDWQLQCFYRMGLISEPTDEALLAAWREFQHRGR